MIHATKVLGQHRWTEAAADTVVLDFDDRHRRRMAMTGTRGLEFLLDLENAVALRGGPGGSAPPRRLRAGRTPRWRRLAAARRARAAAKRAVY